MLLVDPDDNRLPGVFTLDLRAEKGFTFGTSQLMLTLDMFNVLNSSTTLGRQYDATATVDRVLQDAGDHEPAAHQAGGAVPVLSRVRIQRPIGRR